MAKRETKWNDKTRATILRWVGSCYHQEVAAARARVSESQLTQWIHRGQIERDTWAEYVDGGGDPEVKDAPQYTDFAEFYDDLEEARAKAQAELVDPIINSENNEDRKWLAERLYHKQFGRSGRMQVEVAGPGGKPIEIADARRELFNRLDGMLERDADGD